MFGMKAKETARKFKDPKVDDVKAPDVDLGESFRKADSEAPKAKKKQTFGEAFKAARARPTGSGSTFMYNGKSYSIGTKEEEATRPGGRGLQTRSSTGLNSKKSNSPVAKAAKTASEFISSGGGPAAGIVAASRYMTRGGGSAPSGAGALSGAPYAQQRREKFDEERKAKAKENYGDYYGMKAKAANAETAYTQQRRAAREKFDEERKAKIGATKMNMGGMTGYKSGGSCGSGMKKYARGGGVESHGKTKGAMVKMASGGSVSARADGVASKGKTNCKIC